MPVRWGVHQIPQYHNTAPIQLSGRGQVRLGSWIISFGLVGGAWGAPNKGNADGAEGIFDKLRARVGYGPAPGPT